jgi:hypothetical protein
VGDTCLAWNIDVMCVLQQAGKMDGRITAFSACLSFLRSVPSTLLFLYKYMLACKT